MASEALRKNLLSNSEELFGDKEKQERWVGLNVELLELLRIVDLAEEMVSSSPVGSFVKMMIEGVMRNADMDFENAKSESEEWYKQRLCEIHDELESMKRDA